jgi:hypothetical protein
MQQHKIGLLGVALVVAAVMGCCAQSVQPVVPNERGVWQIWAASTNAPDDHAAVVAACREFRTQAPQDPLVVVVTGMEAWRLLKMEHIKEATALLESMLVVPEHASYLQGAGAELARAWLTRLDREKVRITLKKIYVRDIAFPATLEPIKTLKIAALPPFTDRWGKPWVYRLESAIKGMTSQHYVLESLRLGERSDLAKMLTLPYAGQINLEPVRLSPVSPDTVEFMTKAGKSAFLQAGGALGGVTVAYLGSNLIVLADENHWRVVLKPR